MGITPNDILQQKILLSLGQARNTPQRVPGDVPVSDRSQEMMDIIMGGPEVAFQRELDRYLGKGEGKKGVLKKILAGVGEVAAGFGGQQTPIQRMQQAARDTWKTQVPALNREIIADQNNQIKLLDMERKGYEALQKLSLEDRKLAETISARIQRGDLKMAEYLTNKDKIEAETKKLLAQANEIEGRAGFIKQFGTPTKEIANSLFSMQSPENAQALTDNAVRNNIGRVLGLAQGTPDRTRVSQTQGSQLMLNPVSGMMEPMQKSGQTTSILPGIPGNPEAQRAIQRVFGRSPSGPVNTELIPGRPATPSPVEASRPPVQEIPPTPSPIPPGQKSREVPSTFVPFFIKKFDRNRAGGMPTGSAAIPFNTRGEAYQSGVRLTGMLNEGLRVALEKKLSLGPTLTEFGRVGGSRHKTGFLDMARGVFTQDPLQTNMTATLRDEYSAYQKMVSGLTVNDAERKFLKAARPNEEMLAEDLVQEIIKLRLAAQFYAWRDGAGPGILAKNFGGIQETDPDTQKRLTGSELVSLLELQKRNIMRDLGYNTSTKKFDRAPKINSISDRYFDPDEYAIPYFKSKKRSK